MRKRSQKEAERATHSSPAAPAKQPAGGLARKVARRGKTTTVTTHRDDPLYPRIERVVSALLTKSKIVAPIDVLVGMNLLAPEKLEDWRRGRVPYLEGDSQMNARAVDPEKLRAALRRMTRDNLLIIAERAIEIVPHGKLQALVGNSVRLKDLAQTKPTAVHLLAEVRKFYEAGLQGRYYESFAVNSRNFMGTSEGTEEFTVEFNDLLGKCVHAAENEPPHPVREAFELLLGLLRRIDVGDDVIFFADEGGSDQIGVDWRVALPAYFQCLANTAPPEDFAREVDRTIKDFAEYERSRHLTAARRVASAEQKKALRAVPAVRGRRGAAHTG